MLTDKQIADALDLIDGRYHDVITKYLKKVGDTVNRIGHLNASSINLLVQLRRMGVDTATIERELQEVTRLTKQDIRKLYRKAAQEATADTRIEYLAKGVEPDSIRWEALVEDIWRQTAGAMENLANSSVITDGYREAIDDAVQAVTMGAGDYNSVIRDTVKRIGRAGIQVEYESTYLASDGKLKHHKRRLDSAVRQNVLDGIRQVQQKAQELIGEEIGADGVDISAHPNSAPDHEPVQGRRFDMANFQRMQSGLDFEDVDGKHYAGFERPITQWRCRHLIFYILLGVTRRMYTDEQLKSWETANQKGCVIDGKRYTNYEATQLMRNLETEIRRQKDTAVLAKASGDDVLRRECQSNITKLTRKYDQVAEAAGLRKQMQRTRVEGFVPVRENVIANAEKTATIEPKTEKTEVVNVRHVTCLDKDKYKCVSEDITTDEVVITDERIKHIMERHPNDYERFNSYIATIVENPDYILEDKHPATALVLKQIEESGERFRLALRLVTSSDNPEYKNSVITFLKIREKEWNRLIKNKNILYKAE